MEKILLVDDDQLVLSAYARVLRGKYETSLVTKASEALKLLSRNRYDLIITDIFMPDCDGMELIQTIRRICLSIPILVISGSQNYESDLFLDISKSLGASKALMKPVEDDVLLETIDTLLNCP